jgi:hypothetical protein
MATGRIFIAAVLLSVSSRVGQAQAQENQTIPQEPAASGVLVKVPLIVPKGTSIQVVIDKEVKIDKVGQSIHGRTVEPIYAFDKMVISAGAEVAGEITQLDEASNRKRTLDALNADFTPARTVGVAFDQIVLPDGKHIVVQTVVTPGSGQVIEFVTAADKEQKNSVQDMAAKKAKEVKEQAKREWENGVAQVQAPGKIHRAERYLLAQLPVHPQYIDPGTVYFAELQEALPFGEEPFTPEMAKAIGATPPDGSSVRARLNATLSSATARKGDEVEAVLSQPLFDGKVLIYPQGSQLKGTVVQVRAARRLKREGQLRVVFHEIVPPDGIEQKIQANLEAVESGQSQDLKLDSEGGAEVQTPKKRYLQTGIALGLAAASSGDDGINQAEGGAGGFRVVGIVLGLAGRSQPLGMAMGAIGASRSIYTHFIARGRDAVFPKNTAMVIGIGTRTGTPGAKTEGVASVLDGNCASITAQPEGWRTVPAR